MKIPKLYLALFASTALALAGVSNANADADSISGGGFIATGFPEETLAFGGYARLGVDGPQGQWHFKFGRNTPGLKEVRWRSTEVLSMELGGPAECPTIMLVLAGAIDVNRTPWDVHLTVATDALRFQLVAVDDGRVSWDSAEIGFPLDDCNPLLTPLNRGSLTFN